VDNIEADVNVNSVGTGLNWLGTGYICELLWILLWNIRVPSRRGSAWPAKQLL